MNLLNKLRCFYNGHTWLKIYKHDLPFIVCSRCEKHGGTLSNKLFVGSMFDVRDIIIQRELELKCLMCGETLGMEWTDKRGYHIHICRKCRPLVINQYREGKLHVNRR